MKDFRKERAALLEIDDFSHARVIFCRTVAGEVFIDGSGCVCGIELGSLSSTSYR